MDYINNNTGYFSPPANKMESSELKTCVKGATQSNDSFLQKILNKFKSIHENLLTFFNTSIKDEASLINISWNLLSDRENKGLINVDMEDIKNAIQEFLQQKDKKDLYHVKRILDQKKNYLDNDADLYDVLQCIMPLKSFLMDDEFAKLLIKNTRIGQLIQEKAVQQNDLDAYLLTIHCGLEPQGKHVYTLTSNIGEKLEKSESNIDKYKLLLKHLPHYCSCSDAEKIMNNVSKIDSLKSIMKSVSFRRTIVNWSISIGLGILVGTVLITKLLVPIVELSLIVLALYLIMKR